MLLKLLANIVVTIIRKVRQVAQAIGTSVKQMVRDPSKVGAGRS